MAFSVARFVAWRYVRAPRKEGFISVIAGFSFAGIFLGVATLILVMSIMNGFRHELMDRLLSFNGHVTVHSLTGPIDVRTLAHLPGVAMATPLLEKQGVATAGGQSAGCMIRGINGTDLAKRKIIAGNLVSGSLKDFSGASVVMGHKLAQRLGIQVGQSVKIMRPEGRPSAFGTLPVSRHFRLAALFDSGMHEYDKACLFMPLETCADFYDVPQITSYEIFMHDPSALEPLKQRLFRPSLVLVDWQQNNMQFFKALTIQRNVMTVILTLILMIAVFNIVSCLVMMVKDKTRDVAILRTLGASPGLITRIFFLTGAWIGVTSTAAGAAVGIGLAANIDRLRKFLENVLGTQLFQPEIYFLSTLPSRVQGADVAMVVGLALGFSFLATLYPAYKAARLNPVEGLRYA
jgi:lipoprotein-releasing system permease protein